MSWNEKKLLKIIKEEYTKRLLQLEVAATIAEAELVDKRGNMLITKDLKVKHKASGYEYTVDHVDGEGDSAKIYLRNPDVPRIDPPPVMKRMNEMDAEDQAKQSGELTLTKDTDPHVFYITPEEFENEYIVD